LLMCSICHTFKDVLVNETWAGQLHSACTHCACQDCLVQWIRACNTSRIPCYSEGCPKILPERLRTEISRIQRTLPACHDYPEGLQARAAQAILRQGLQQDRRTYLFKLNSTVWDATLELTWLQNRAASWGCHLVPAQHLARNMVLTETIRCFHCFEEKPALLVNPACGHWACASCWAESAARGASACKDDEIQAWCCQPDCKEEVSWGLIRGICVEYSAALREHVAKIDKQFGMKDQPRRCLHCGKIIFSFFMSGQCSHVACEACQLSWVESQLQTCTLQGRTAVPCLSPGCGRGIDGKLWNHLRRTSEKIADFHTTLCSKLSRLRQLGRQGVKLKWAPSVDIPGPICGCCNAHHLALLENSCGHSACQECWTRFAESEATRCLLERRFRLQCFSKCCKDAIAIPLWDAISDQSRYSCANSRLIHFDQEVRRVTFRLQALAQQGFALQWTPSTSEVGPRCVICNEPQWALVMNTPCSHSACEDCWARWAESQISWCKMAQRDVGRCFWPNCEEVVVMRLQILLESHSGQLKDFSSIPEVAHRRRLRDSALYPAAMQVDCPRAACWGLGYLGFETVMCFMCEFQWAPEDGGIAIPIDINVEEIMGVKVKKCPRCSEYIEKNGGCDHMRCRCGYEFWWSSLTPYRS